jgi:hypothetical protein
MKAMLNTLFDIEGVVHFEFVPHGQTLNQAYVEILKQLHEAVRRKRPELWPKDWIVHHENSTAQKAFYVKQFLAGLNIDY